MVHKSPCTSKISQNSVQYQKSLNNVKEIKKEIIVSDSNPSQDISDTSVHKHSNSNFKLSIDSDDSSDLEFKNFNPTQKKSNNVKETKQIKPSL